ncbi:hypothetical protein G9C98_001719 [Cotesia typhae]|uniref:Uncharacterized protein n=1 Tax=Cotesia typhae TaxID=2053667 RepID=A0A8J5RA18_9HYME|nr:hypothetical protein G9C98_001719 [Cotesia typhae]
MRLFGLCRRFIECNLVTISQIKLTNNGLSFRLNNPNTRTPDYINLHKTEQKLFNGNTIVHFAKRVNYRWKIGHTKTLGQYLPGFDGVTLYHNYFRRSAIMLYRKGSSYIVEGNIGGRILRYINELEREFDYDTYKQEYYNLGAENLERVHVKLLPIIDGRILNYGIFATSARIKHELKHCEGFGETYIRMNSRRRTFLPWIDQCVANMMSHYFKNHDCSYFSTNEF